jgi:hypothetical protein
MKIEMQQEAWHGGASNSARKLEKKKLLVHIFASPFIKALGSTAAGSFCTTALLFCMEVRETKKYIMKNLNMTGTCKCSRK